MQMQHETQEMGSRISPEKRSASFRWPLVLPDKSHAFARRCVVDTDGEKWCEFETRVGLFRMRTATITLAEGEFYVDYDAEVIRMRAVRPGAVGSASGH